MRYLVIFDQITHRVVNMAPEIQIASLYNTENAPFTVLILVVIAITAAVLAVFMMLRFPPILDAVSFACLLFSKMPAKLHST